MLLKDRNTQRTIRFRQLDRILRRLNPRMLLWYEQQERNKTKVIYILLNTLNKRNKGGVNCGIFNGFDSLVLIFNCFNLYFAEAELISLIEKDYNSYKKEFHLLEKLH